MARPVYQYKPIKTTNTIPLGISLPFNAPSGKKSVDAAYDAAIEDANGQITVLAGIAGTIWAASAVHAYLNGPGSEKKKRLKNYH